MNPIELLVSILAPHTCLACGKEGSILCLGCARTQLKVLPPLCYRCGAASPGYMPCPACLPASPLGHVWPAASYEGTAKDLVASLKFDRAKASAAFIAGHMHAVLPSLVPETVVVPVPTANKRVRKRGYDQAGLIARSFAKKRKLACKDALRRAGSTRQVGASREDRFKQLKNSYTVCSPKKLAGKHILLIDDVLTTGATLESAAKTLRAAGVRSVDAAVFAYSRPKNQLK